jgi:hypothetical protein
MGYDLVTLDKELPEYGIRRRTIFQSRSLHAGDGHFTISAEGRLVEHLGSYEPDPTRLNPLTQQPLYRRVYVGDQIIEYHGDILLYGPSSGKGSGEWVARFTHGRLEWIRSVEEYADINHIFLVEQGAR